MDLTATGHRISLLDETEYGEFIMKMNIEYPNVLLACVSIFDALPKTLQVDDFITVFLDIEYSGQTYFAQVTVNCESFFTDLKWDPSSLIKKIVSSHPIFHPKGVLTLSIKMSFLDGNEDIYSNHFPWSPIDPFLKPQEIPVVSGTLQKRDHSETVAFVRTKVIIHRYYLIFTGRNCHTISNSTLEGLNSIPSGAQVHGIRHPSINKYYVTIEFFFL
jgi:hypothetical protein